MSTPIELKTRAEYERVIRPLLPADAFAPAPRKLWAVAIHLVVVCGGYAWLRLVSNALLYPICSLVIVHSLGCIAFLAHELSHNTIVRSRHLKRALELLLWGINILPPTLWIRIHNQTHHIHPNGTQDTDRMFLSSENSRCVRWFIRTFVPSNGTMRWLPTVFFNFVTYIARYTITAFYPDNTKPVLATRRPAFISGDRWRIAIELAVILAIQVCVFFAVGGRWVSYLWAGPISYLAASAVVMSYIWTNHTLNPLCEENDPLLASTTVSVPSLFNHLHSNFSFHTEHHVFPSLNSDYYPLVAKLLKEQYPDRYNEIPFGEAWRQLWLRDKFLDLNGASKCRNETYVEKEKNNDAL